MSLFNEMERIDIESALYAEPKFSYLNRSARPGAQRIRELLELWFSHYPAQHQPELRTRLRSQHDNQHLSAFFELCLHELLIRFGSQVEIHPPLAGNPRRPDFLVQPRAGSGYYLEAVLATDESQEEAAARARMNVVYDALDRMDSPSFFVGMKLRGAPETPPPARQIRIFLEQQLEELDPDAIARVFDNEGFEALPHWLYEHEGWRIEFFPIPKSQGLRGRPGIRPIGFQFEGAKWLDTRVAIKDAIVNKAGRYGQLELPYVVAVNALADHVDRVDAMEALFGKEQNVFRHTSAGPIGPDFRRAHDGVWTSPHEPQYRRLSAVLLATHLKPSSLPWATVCLYHNPWAARPYDGELGQLPKAISSDEQNMEWFGGSSLAHVFELPSGWPGQ